MFKKIAMLAAAFGFIASIGAVSLSTDADTAPPTPAADADTAPPTRAADADAPHQQTGSTTAPGRGGRYYVICGPSAPRLYDRICRRYPIVD